MHSLFLWYSNTGPCHPYGKLGRCTISRMRLDGTGLETFAAGVRNSVGAPVWGSPPLPTWCCAGPHTGMLVCRQAPHEQP